MLHTEPVGDYLVSICTNIACMLRGAYELLEHAEEHLGIRAGGRTEDGTDHSRRGGVPRRLRQGAVPPGESPILRERDQRGL